MIRRALRPILAVACVALAGWQVRLLLKEFGPLSGGQDMDTAAVATGPFEVGFTREGVLGSPSTITVPIPDRLAWRTRLTWVISEGTQVKKGDLLAKLDVNEYRFEVDSQKLQYQQAVQEVGTGKRNSLQAVEQASQDLDQKVRSVDLEGKSSTVDLDQARAQLGFDKWGLTRAQKDYVREQRLRQAGLVPGTQEEQAERTVRGKEHALRASGKSLEQKEAETKIKHSQSATDIETSKFGLELAQRRVKDTARDSAARVKMLKEQLDRMQTDLGSGELRAPGDGLVVLGTTWDEGGERTLRVGDEVRRSLCTLTDPKSLTILVRVSEAKALRIKVGQPVVVTAEGVPGRRFKGKVSSIGTVAHTVSVWEDTSANATERVFDMTVTVLDVDPKVLRPGMKAKATFVFQHLDKSLYVPLSAVTHRAGEGEFVYVVRGSGFEERKVVTGQRNDEHVVIRSGLRGGERVALGDPTKVEAQ